MRREHGRRIHVRVAVDRAEAQELRILQPRNQPEDARLLRNAQPRLAPDDVPHAPRAILHAELHYGPRAPARARIGEPDRSHGAEAQRVGAPLRDLLDGHAPLEVRHLVERLALVQISFGQRGHPRLVLLARERTIQVGALGVGAVHRLLVPARGAEHHRIVEGFAADDRGDRVVEGEAVGAQPGLERAGERVARERSRGDDGRRRNRRDFLARDRDARVRRDARRDRGRKEVAVDREGGATRHARLIRTLQHHGTQRAHLGLEQAVCVVRFGALERVGTDELGQPIGLMRRGSAHRSHLVQYHVVATLGQLPGRLATRETTADDVERGHATTGSGTSAGSSTAHSLAHLRHFRYWPRVLFCFFSAPSKPHSGHFSFTGRSQQTKSQFG